VLYVDRSDAGGRLADRLRRLRGPDVVVLGIPRGGVPVAAVVAEELDAPLDVLVVRKLGVPGHPELAMGAVGERGVRVVNDDVVRAVGVPAEDFVEADLRERAEVTDRARRFRGAHEMTPLGGRTALVVDDGVATGATMAAACEVARALGAATVVVAVPVASREALARLRRVADEVVCLGAPEPFFGVGRWYRDFRPTQDDDVVALLAEARRRTDDRAGSATPPDVPSPQPTDADTDLEAGDTVLPAHLTVPPGARGLVLFAHGSGSSRHSPRNQHVAAVLQEAGLATVLVDLLTPVEADTRANVFDVGLLARRLVALTRSLEHDPRTAGLPIGYFGASTGAAAALVAAAEPGSPVRAIVSRGGRPDLAGDALPRVAAPTLLVVGARDTAVLGLNHRARRRMRCRCEVVVVPRATHLFEEPGTLDEAARHAVGWFRTHLGAGTPAQLNR
jgi:putative phosphoribosyl transferase